MSEEQVKPTPDQDSPRPPRLGNLFGNLTPQPPDTGPPVNGKEPSGGQRLPESPAAETVEAAGNVDPMIPTLPAEDLAEQAEEGIPSAEALPQQLTGARQEGLDSASTLAATALPEAPVLQAASEFDLPAAALAGITAGPAPSVLASPAMPASAGVASRFFWNDFIIIALLGLILTLLAFTPAASRWLAPLRWGLGLGFTLLIPGYCLTAALFPRQDDIDSLERAGLSLGMSVAYLPVLALILNWLPWGLTLPAILFGILISCVLFMLVAGIQRMLLPAEQVYAPQGRPHPRGWWDSLAKKERLVFSIVVPVFLVLVIAAAWVLSTPSPDEKLTEFFILGKQGLAEEYPRQVPQGQTQSVTVGINNQEGEKLVYWVEVRDGEQLIGVAGPYTLSPGETFSMPVDFTPRSSGENVPIDFYLFRNGVEGPYRSLQLWMIVDPAEALP